MSRLNPLTKLFLLILSNVMLFIHVNEMTEAIMSLLFLLPFFLSGKVKTGVKMAILYYGLLAVYMLLIPRLNGRISVLISLAAISLRMMLPCIRQEYIPSVGWRKTENCICSGVYAVTEAASFG